MASNVFPRHTYLPWVYVSRSRDTANRNMLRALNVNLLEINSISQDMANSLVYFLDRRGGIHDLDNIGMPAGFGQESFSNPGVIGEVAAFHAIGGTGAAAQGNLGWEIEDQG